MRVTDRDSASEAAMHGSDEPEPTARSSRRGFLRAGGAAGLGLVAGSAGAATERASTATQTDGENWASYQFDAGNTGYAPDNTGPVTNVGEKWRDSGEYQFRYPGQAVADGMVYTIRSDGCVAYDAETGTQQWRFEFNGSFIQATPTVWNGTVYSPGEGRIHALNADDGSEEWFFSTVAEIEGETSEEIDGISDVVDGTIYVGGHENSKRLYAVDAETGEKQWHFEVSTQITTTPAVQDGTVYVCSGPDLIAVDAETGTREWRYRTNTLGGIGPPAVADGTVYVGANFFHHAVDAGSGEQLWKTETDAGGALAGQAVADGTVYASSDSGLFALDAETGEKQWDDRWNVLGGAGPPVVVGETVYFMNGSASGEEGQQAKLLAVDATSGDELWSVTPENPAVDRIEPIAVANSTVYACLGESLYAIEGDAPEPATATLTATGTASDETPGEAGENGGPPLVPIGAGALLAALVGLLLVLFGRRDDEDEKTGDDSRSNRR